MNIEIPKKRFDVPTSSEFTHTLGQATWLMSVDPICRDHPVTWITEMIMAPLLLKQLRIYLKGKRPFAAITWAYASPEIEKKIAMDAVLELGDWRSGSTPMIVSCVSPFADADEIKAAFCHEIQQIENAH